MDTPRSTERHLSLRFLSATQAGDDAATAALPRRAGRLAGTVAGLRGRELLALDLPCIAAAAYLALALRYDRPPDVEFLAARLPILGLLLAVRVAVNVRFGLYSRRWRFASVPDLERIVTAIALGSCVAAAIFYGSQQLLGVEWGVGFPRSFWPAEMVISIAALGGLRFGIRALSDREQRLDRESGVARRPTLLYGAGRTGVLVARWARRDAGSEILPVGFLDDDPTLAGGLVEGLRVFGGLPRLGWAVSATGARALLITMPSASGSAVRAVVEAAQTLDLDVRTVPSLTELLDGTVDAYRIRRVRVEDLLQRPTVVERAEAVREIIEGRTIAITGAGGSIGSELARQVFAIGPRRLVLIDRAESPLYTVQRELETRRVHGRGYGELRVHLANVTSRGAIDRLVDGEAPDVIFHAAAYKQLPMLEGDPSDAAWVNVGGTLMLLDAARSAGVGRFVFVSTDKAVRPTSVMGASKRIAEMLVADAARRTGRPYVTVRFGNVLGSTGSVLPLFQEQLERGEPLTITHPDMTRFFMTIPEAAWLILDAAALGESGDLFVLDMGQPVRILDLARDLVRLAGRDPESQPIEIVGLRPGEKLHEELFYAEERVEHTSSAKVLRVVCEPPPAEVREDALRMLALASGDAEPSLRDTLLAYALGESRAGESAATSASDGSFAAPDALGARGEQRAAASLAMR